MLNCLYFCMSTSHSAPKSHESSLKWVTNFIRSRMLMCLPPLNRMKSNMNFRIASLRAYLAFRSRHSLVALSSKSGMLSFLGQKTVRRRKNCSKLTTFLIGALFEMYLKNISAKKSFFTPKTFGKLRFTESKVQYCLLSFSSRGVFFGNSFLLILPRALNMLKM